MPKLIPSLILSCFIIVLLCLWWADEVIDIGMYFGVTEKEVSLGDWGDAFAPINAIFSGLAFLGVAATVYLQRKANLQTKVENGKAEFERTFFQIFGLIRELRSELKFASYHSFTVKSQTTSASVTAALHPDALAFQKIHRPRKEHAGIEAIKAAYHTTNDRIPKQIPAGPTQRKRLAKIYNISVNRRNEAEFGPYFRAIYTVLKRIDVCDYLDEEAKLDYSRLLRSQMTSQETALLGLNGLSPNSKDLSDYLIKYRMLKYSQEGRIRSALEACYPPQTFEARTTR